MQDPPTTSFRLSPQQAQLWQLQDNPGRSVVQAALAFSGALDGERLRAALETVVERHEILRTTYRTPAGMRLPLQAVEDSASFGWSADEALGATPDELLAREREREIDIERAPALHARLTRVGDNEHVLVLALPALSGDAGTFDAIAGELAALYVGRDEALEEEPLQYADYAEWQHELAESDDAEALAARSEWRAQCADELPELELPSSGDSDASGTVRATVELGSEAVAALAEPAAFVLAAWESLLTRVTGSNELAVDVIVDGREDEELRSALGLLAKPVRVRVAIDPARPFAEAVKAAQDSLASVTRWRDSISQEPGAAPAAAFEFVGGAGSRQLEELGLSVAAHWSAGSGAPVKLTAFASRGSLELEVSGDARRIDAGAAQRLAASLRTLLAEAAAGPDTALGALDLLADEDRRLIAELNATDAPIPAVAGVHELFERQASDTPERPAVVASGESLTYRELNERANRLAHALRGRGAGPEKAVGIFLERSIESIVALLGALKAGAAALPLSVDHPAGRIEHQLGESNAVAVVTLDRFADRLPSADVAVIRLDGDGAALAGEPDTDPEPVTTPADLAYVIYTSGSTGLPKGVGVTHRGIVNYACDMRIRLGADDGEARHFALVSPIVTDLGNTCVYPALVSGGCLHVVDESTAMDGSLYGAYAYKNQIDILKITPSHLAALLATGDPRLVLPRQKLVVGGESSSWELIEQALAEGCSVLNHYGPTETTVGSLTFPVTHEALSARRTAAVPIGRPISNTELLILDATGRRAPIGVAGELCIGGAGVARGYMGRPDETAERFVSHPEHEGEPIYRTGDLARLLPTGDVEFLGRIDRQVKIRG
ncbi:MAG TPA: amino acid adenylation domain-containing protein, partial [Thermoleophilaceae bacterium]|nr:amino acid adenylation domain-containing protein [Thermoleophilaceae bacterium]